MLNSRSKRVYRLILPVVLAMATSMATALAQTTTPTTPAPTPVPAQGPGAGERGQEAMTQFDHYLDTHPDAAQQLRQNPSLLNDPTWMSKHPELQQWMSKHPNFQKDVQAHPEAAMARERRFERSGGDITRNELAKTDNFLDTHPGIARQLQKDPSLIDNKQFLQAHPQLEHYLKTHPEVRKDWQEHPKAFERKEAQYNRREARQQRRNQRVPKQ